MKKSITWLYLLLFLGGIVGGLFFRHNTAMASAPIGSDGNFSDRTGAETTASVWYDERWRAASAIVTSLSGYKTMSEASLLAGQTSFQATGNTVAGVLENNSGWGITLQPKMVVTQWRVTGHIHFQ
ncbi:MAG: hypothetical protein PHW69_06525 [Elusimicrobiaceae bacterium]|nr:hypothetical protein [Elusimicrobiaceae bacterium]